MVHLTFYFFVLLVDGSSVLPFPFIGTSKVEDCDVALNPYH